MLHRLGGNHAGMQISGTILPAHLMRAHHQKTPWDYASYQAHESQHESLTLREVCSGLKCPGFRRFVKQVNRDLETSDPVGLSERYYTETSNGKAGDGLGDRIDPFRSNLTETTETSGGSFRWTDADDPAPPPAPPLRMLGPQNTRDPRGSHSTLHADPMGRNGHVLQGIMGPFTAAKQHCEFRGVVGSTWAMADADGRDPYWTFLRVDAFGENRTKCPYHERSAGQRRRFEAPCRGCVERGIDNTSRDRCIANVYAG